MKRMPLRALLLAGLLVPIACVTIEYRDGYLYVSGVPSGIKSIQIRLKARDGTYRQTISAAVDEEGRSEPMCLGAMFRRTYRRGEIEITCRDADGKKVREVKNKGSVTFNGTEGTQEIPFDQFE